MSAGRSALLGLAAVEAAGSRALRRAVAAADGFVAGVLDAALAPDEKSEIGVRLYDDSAQYRGERGLFDWEQAWFARHLPRAGAGALAPRVLVGGCGAGRELGPLLEAGYTVHAFDPAPSLVALAAQRHPAARTRVATFESWARDPSVDSDGDVDGGSAGPVHLGDADEAASRGEPHYDAILFGWGSLSHVLDPGERLRVLQRAASACPHGPILVSYWARTFDTDSRARRVGAGVGRVVARARGVDGAASGDPWQPSTGFVHPFTEAELCELGAAIGRRFVREGGPGDYPHGVFVGREG